MTSDADEIVELRFVCDGNTRTGFGHVARCLTLAAIVTQRLQRTRITFQGDYSDQVVKRIRAEASDAVITGPDCSQFADLAILDRLSHPDILDCQDDGLLKRAARQCSRLLFIASGLRIPDMPQNAEVVGYQPGGGDGTCTHWGFEYAPVTPLLLEGPFRERRPDFALIALGSHVDHHAASLALTALSQMPEIGRIAVFGSPAMPSPLPLDGMPVPTTLHAGLPVLARLLREAGVVIASFGNLAYEALALGAPLVLLAQKQFQADLASRFADLGLAVNCGLARESTAWAVRNEIRHALVLAPELSEAGPKAVDGKGLIRIAAIIEELILAPSSGR